MATEYEGIQKILAIMPGEPIRPTIAEQLQARIDSALARDDVQSAEAS